jgi:putative glutamine amidotransferase
MQAPLVALSPNFFPAEERHFYTRKGLEYGEESLARAVREAGGLPVLAYRAGADPEGLADHAARVMERTAGLLLTGGADVAPSSYGETPAREAWSGDPERDRWEIALYRAARAAGRPVLGVCRGLQLMNVAEEGSLWQDLASLFKSEVPHRDQTLYDQLGHPLEVAPRSWLALELPGIQSVNTVHHQGIRRLAEPFEAIAWAPDGLVEAIAHRDGSFCLGVQWHPEWMPDDPLQRRLFVRFVETAAPGPR